MNLHKHLLSYTLRISVSVFLIIWVIKRVDFIELAAKIRSIHILVFLATFFIWQVGVVQRTWRWQILLNGAGIHMSFRRLLSLNYHALFFNVFLPTGFGGDVVRIVTIEQEANLPRGQVGGLTILDRIIGSATAAITAGLMLPFAWSILPTVFRYTAFLISIGGVALLIILLTPMRFSTNGIWFNKLQEYSIAGNIYEVLQRLQRGAIINSILVSFTHTLLIIFIHYLVGKANYINVSLKYFTIFTPLVTMSALLPSIQGVGVRENMYILLLGHLNVPVAQAALVGLGANLLNILTGLSVGIINLISPLHKQIELEL